MTVYVSTNRFKPESFCYNASTCSFSTALNNTPEPIKHGQAALKQIFQKGRKYTKAGGVFLNLAREGYFQQDLFDTTDSTRPAIVIKAMDEINTKIGSQTLKYLSTGISENNSWRTAFDNRSPAYITNWDHLLTFSC